MTARRAEIAEETRRKFPQQVCCEFVPQSGKDEPMRMQEEQAESEITAGKFRFIFGVSGHRDTLGEDAAELQKQIGTVFDRFRLAYPNAAFELLSPLAEGADRIAAEVALRAGIQLVVPLPMPQSEYERDFTTAASLAEFHRLLAKATSAFEVGSDQTEPRANKYAAVGDYIARRSNVLILLWDGKDNSKIGGTAWVKKRRDYWTNLSDPSADAPNPFGYAGTIHIVTPRQTAGRDRPRIEIIGDLPAAATT